MEKTTTRSTLSEAVFKNVGLSRNESASLVDSVFGEILNSLIQGSDVKISSFGTFVVRKKKRENRQKSQNRPGSPDYCSKRCNISCI